MIAVAISFMNERHHIIRRHLLLGANVGPCAREYVSVMLSVGWFIHRRSITPSSTEIDKVSLDLR